MACPLCGSDRFYVKNPEDEYETSEFDWKGGRAVVASEEEGSWRPQITETVETYCGNCAWHGKIKELKK
jgi:hypothetical protein